MQSMTLAQLRAASDEGRILLVTLRGRGDIFFVEVAHHGGDIAVLVNGHEGEPRRFSDPLTAVNLLKELGVTAGMFDAADYVSEKLGGDAVRDRSKKEADYKKWLASEIQASIDDPRPSIPHDQVMAEMDADILAFQIAARKPR